MRIGIDATTIYTSKPTGLGVFSINIVNELAKLHDDLVVWTIDDSTLHIEKSKIRKVLQPFRFLGDNMFQFRPIWVNTVFPRLIRKEGIDVLYSTIPISLAAPPVPHAVTVHDLIPLTFPDEGAPRSVRWNFRYKLPTILKNAAKVITVSEFTRQDVLHHYRLDPAKVCTVMNGFDQALFIPTNDMGVLERYSLKNKEYLLYVGSASPRKNLTTVIKSFSMIRGLIPHTLALVGPKSSEQIRQLMRLIRKYGVEDRVTLINYVPFCDLPALYSGAALFLYLSYYEGFGLPLVESMACGTPVVAAATTSLPEVVGDTALLVDPADSGAVARAVVNLLRDKARLDWFSKGGVEQSHKFNWSSAASDILSILHQIHKGL